MTTNYMQDLLHAAPALTTAGRLSYQARHALDSREGRGLDGARTYTTKSEILYDIEHRGKGVTTRTEVRVPIHGAGEFEDGINHLKAACEEAAGQEKLSRLRGKLQG